MSQSRVPGGPSGEKMPKDPRAFLQLAEEHRRNGRLKEAIAVCLEGLGLHPGLDAARITLGRAYLESDQPETARATLEEVFGRLPEHHLAGKLLAEAQQRLGDLTAAEETCRSLLRHYPRDREIESILESVLRRDAPAGGTAAASPAAAADPQPEYMPEDVELKPTTGPAAPQVAAPAVAVNRSPAGDAFQTSTLADLYLRQGLVDRAIEVYRAMLRVDPGNRRAQQRLAEIEAGAAHTAPDATSAAASTHPPAARPTPAVSGRQPAAPAAALPGAPPTDARRQVTARLEEWLDTIRRASTGKGTVAR